MQIVETALAGCFELIPTIRRDQRGYFVKTFQEDEFLRHGLETRFAEEYYTVSSRNVIRGLHFQIPPHELTKMVYCVFGQVLDAVVDLRRASPTYGNYVTVDLSAEKANVIYIPPGLAHGFSVRSEKAVVLYRVSSAYAPQNDSGILWDSVGIPWDNAAPLLSERDHSFAPLSNFDSPFLFNPQT